MMIPVGVGVSDEVNNEVVTTCDVVGSNGTITMIRAIVA